MQTKVKDKKCRYCKVKFTPYRPLQVACSTICAIKIAEDKEDKKRRREVREKKEIDLAFKRKVKQSDIKLRKKAAVTACHLYIRTRDADKLCPCCGESLGADYQAGHYIPSGQNPLIRFDERNIHGQRLNCNYFKGGDSGGYKEELINRIGEQEVEEIESLKGGQVKWTPEIYTAIEKHYKAKLKRIKDGTNTEYEKLPVELPSIGKNKPKNL